MNAQEIIEQLRALKCIVDATASRVICDPAPTDTDEDYLVEVDGGAEGYEAIIEHLKKIGFIPEGDQDHYADAIENHFTSYRKDKINLILTAQTWFAKRHRLATKVCKKLNLLKKEDRIMIFRALLYTTYSPDEAEMNKVNEKDIV